MDYEKKYKEALKEAEKIHKFSSDIAEIKRMEQIFPELKESEDERIRKALIENFKWYCGGFPETTKWGKDDNLLVKDIIAWLEKQGKQPSAIKWYDVSLIPHEMEELLVEWDSDDATWHEIAFYHADTKTFWNGTSQVENVTRWCYIIDLLEKQGGQFLANSCKTCKDEQKPAWSERDEYRYNACLQYFEEIKPDSVYYKDYLWLKSLKQRINV